MCDSHSVRISEGTVVVYHDGDGMHAEIVRRVDPDRELVEVSNVPGVLRMNDITAVGVYSDEAEYHLDPFGKDRDRITTAEVDEPDWIPYGDETRVLASDKYDDISPGSLDDQVVYLPHDTPECPDCGVDRGELHVAGCDVEQCPKCLKPLGCCTHIRDSDGEWVTRGDR